MYSVKIFNKISEDGLSILRDANIEVSEDVSDPNGIMLRSFQLHDYKFNPELRCIGRAGAGVNNIPVDKCTQEGIVVFNSPGANANAVKELVLAGLFLSSRDIVGGIEFVKKLASSSTNIHSDVEKNKSRFKGFEVKNKRLGVIGLGAIGVMVANDAVNIGLKVLGHDPFISVSGAWALSNHIKREDSVDRLLAQSDFITLHMPLTEQTSMFINRDRLSQLKEGAILLNFARPEIVDEEAILEALDSGRLQKYVTDFPSDSLMKHPNVIGIPHLGASTQEAEDNCSIMVANQMKDYLLNGNITNSVNYPNINVARSGDFRIVLTNKNIPNMVGQISSLLAENSLNIVEMANKSRGDIAYNIIDVIGKQPEKLSEKIKNIEGVLRVRILN